MIALSWLFLLAAIATLLVGIFSEPIAWIYASIGSSVLAIVLLVVGLVRGKPVQPATAGAPYGPPVGTAGARGGRAAATAASSAPARTAAPRRPATPTAPTAPARKPAAKKAAARKPAAKKTAARKPAAKKTAAAATSTRGTVVAIPERGTYHKAECRYVQGRTDTEQLKATTAKSRGFKACGVCKP
ncbi:MAG: hypothetical protein ACRDHM_05410 [Actinomycetota bacterium]